MVTLTIKTEFTEQSKAVVANTKVEAEFEADSEDFTETFIKEKSSLIRQKGQELMDEALAYSRVRTQQKTRG